MENLSEHNQGIYRSTIDLKKAKHSGKAYLKIPDDYNPEKITGLPSPFDLTGDPDWDKDGNLLRMYNLNLIKTKKDVADEVFTSVKEVFTAPLNSSDGSEDVEYIEECDDEDEGVKVLRGNQEETENNCEEDSLSDHDRAEDLFSKMLIEACKREDSMKAFIAC